MSDFFMIPFYFFVILNDEMKKKLPNYDFVTIFIISLFLFPFLIFIISIQLVCHFIKTVIVEFYHFIKFYCERL